MRKDVNAVAVVRPKPDQIQTKRAVDLYPNTLHQEFKVTGHVPKLMHGYLVNQVFEEANQLW